MKTRVSPSTTRNWNVDVLLRSPPEGRTGYDRRHFHQLFHQLRVAHRGAHRDVIEQDLGHFDSLLGNRLKRVEEAHDVRQLIHRQRHRIIEKRHQRGCVDDMFHGAPLYPRMQTGQGSDPVRPSSFGVPRQTDLSTPNPPWSWPTSGSVERRTSRALHLRTKSGAGLRRTPCARSSVCVEETSGAGAPSSAVRSQSDGRDQHKSHPLGFESSQSHKQGNVCLSQTPGGVCGGGGADQVYDVCLSPYAPTKNAPDWVAEHLGASSRRPRHPFPALMAGVNPGRVPVYTALKRSLMSSS